MGGSASCFTKQQVQVLDSDETDETPLTPVSRAHMALSQVAVTDATQFREDDEGYLQKTFSMWDTNGDGQLSLEEFASMLESCGIELSELDMQRLMKAVDLDENGTVELEKLTAWLRLSPSLTRYFDAIATIYADLEEQLDQIEADDGMEQYEEIRKLARQSLKRKLIPLIDEVFATNDRDGNGELDEDECALLSGNFVAQLVKAPVTIEAIVGLVTCSSYEDVISAVCKTAFSSKSGEKLTEAQLVTLERKSRFEVQMEIVKRRHMMAGTIDDAAQKSSYRQAFKVVDANGDGRLSREEVTECLLPSAKNDTCRKFLSALGLMVDEDQLKLIAEEMVAGVLKEHELASKAEQQWQKLRSIAIKAPFRKARFAELSAPVRPSTPSSPTLLRSQAARDAFSKPRLKEM